MSELPRGTVTLVFTDIEGSTRLLQELGDGWGDVLEQHRRRIREAVERHVGVEVEAQRDGFFLAFERADDAVAAAAAAQRALSTRTSGPRSPCSRRPASTSSSSGWRLRCSGTGVQAAC